MIDPPDLLWTRGRIFGEKVAVADGCMRWLNWDNGDEVRFFRMSPDHPRTKNQYCRDRGNWEKHTYKGPRESLAFCPPVIGQLSPCTP